MSRKEGAAPPSRQLGPDGRRPLLLTFVGNNRQMLNEIRDSLSHLRKNDVIGEGQSSDHLFPPGSLFAIPQSLKPDLSQSTPNLLDKPGGGGNQGSKMTRRDNPHDKALAEIRDSLKPFQNASGVNSSGGTSLHNGGSGGSDNSSVASSTSSHATSIDPEPSQSMIHAVMQYGFDEDLAVRALKLSGNQGADAAIKLINGILRSTNKGMFQLTPRSNLGPGSPAASDTNSVRSESPGLGGPLRQHHHQQQQQQQRQQHHLLTNGGGGGLQSPPPPIPPRAPINSSASHRGQTPPPSSTEPSLMGSQAVSSQHYQSVLGKPLMAAGTGGGKVVPQGHVQHMIQLMNPGVQGAYYHSAMVAAVSAVSTSKTQSPNVTVNGVIGKLQHQYQRGVSPISHQHAAAMAAMVAAGGGVTATTSSGHTPTPSPLLSQQLQSIMMGNSSASTPSSSPSPALTPAFNQPQVPPPSYSQQAAPSPSYSQPQALLPSYSQAQAQIQAARLGVISSPTSTLDTIDSRRRSPLLDVTMLPDVQQQQQQHHYLQQSQQQQGPQRSKLVAVPATRMPMSSTHMPVIMPSVRSKEVTKPMPQTATAPLVPPGAMSTSQGQHSNLNNGHVSGVSGRTTPQHSNYVSQLQAQINNLNNPLPNHHYQQHTQQQQAHTPRIMAASSTTASHYRWDGNIPDNTAAVNSHHHYQQHPIVATGVTVPQDLRNCGGAGGGGPGGSRLTPEQLAALAAASAGQPTTTTAGASPRRGTVPPGTGFPPGLYRQFNLPDSSLTSPRSDSPVSRATNNHSPMSLVSTTSSPSNNSDMLPGKPPPPYPGRGPHPPHINPPLLPPRIPLKDKQPPPPPHPAASIKEQEHAQLLANAGPAFPLLPASASSSSPSSPSMRHTASPDTPSVDGQGKGNSSPPVPAAESSSPPSETDETDTDTSSVSAGPTGAASGGGGGESSRTETTTTRCLSPLPQRKSEARERDRLRHDTKVKNYSPQAFKFYMEQHVENLLKSHNQRQHRRLQLEEEMAKVNLSDEAAKQMRKMLHQKESNYIRLKRAKMDPCMFDKIKTLGVGAFGEVALVRKKDVGSLYAMKTLTKSNVIKRNQVAHVKAERDILAEADNEWVVKLYYSFQDETNLYFVMDYVPGGDLMGQLIRKEILEEKLAQFYIAELVLAIESVHRMGFIHRDIKPDNILIDKDGHIKLTDFGLCTGFRWTHNSKYYQKDGSHARQDSMEVNCQFDEDCRCEILKPLEQRRQREQKRGQAHSLVGTPNYIAPEVLLRLGYTKVCDWWSVGVILYEMVIGQPPFYANTPQETQLKVIHWKDTLNMSYCGNISAAAQDLIRQLLQGPESRLGRNGAQEIKQHPFFAGMNFEGLRRQPAPEKPTIRFLTDTSNFDPVDPDKLRTNDSDASNKKTDARGENGKHPEHAFFEFTFRRFFDDGGHPCPMPASSLSSITAPAQQTNQQQQQQQQHQPSEQELSNNSPVYV